MQIGEIGGRHHAPMALEKTNGRMRPQIARSTQMPYGVIVKHTDRAGGATDGHGFFRMRKVVSMRARLRHVPKGQKFIAQGVASLALGYGGRWAFSPHSLTFNTAPLTRARAFPYLLTRLLSHEPAPFLPDSPTCPSKTQCPFNTQHPSLNNSHPTPNIPHSTFNTQHSTFNFQHPTFHIIKCWG